MPEVRWSSSRDYRAGKTASRDLLDHDRAKIRDVKDWTIDRWVTVDELAIIQGECGSGLSMRRTASLTNKFRSGGMTAASVNTAHLKISR